jgi:trimeric autotransporter adhesin
MRTSIARMAFGAGVLFAAITAMASDADAQSDILLRLRSGSPAGDRFRVDSAGGLVAMGTLGIGIIPASGCGYRMMWYPYRGAFRAGTTDDGGACTYWDDANIGFYSWAGGNLTRATAFASFAFGDQVTVSGVDAAAFGASNTVSGTVGFSAGGSNECSAFACTAIGWTNRAAGQGSVALGERVHASANWAVALGRRAHAKHTGAFAWGDASTTDSIRSTANNQFSSRAAGGYRFFTNATLTAGVTMSAGGSTWNAVSDRNRKENFAELDGEDILRRLRLVPVSAWNYIAEGTEVRHIGPMAQDWHAAFALNDDPLTINQGDFDGVNLAAVKALDDRTRELPALEREVAALRQENVALRADAAEKDRRIERLEARLERLEAALGRVP